VSPLIGFLPLGQLGEPIELARPHLLQDRGERRQRGPVGPVEPAGAVPANQDEPGLPQDAEMLGDRR
jgi:hypothetical protein